MRWSQTGRLCTIFMCENEILTTVNSTVSRKLRFVLTINCYCGVRIATHTHHSQHTHTHTLYLSFPHATNLNTLHSSSTCFVLIVGSLSSLQIQQPWVTAAIVSLQCQLSLSLSLPVDCVLLPHGQLLSWLSHKIDLRLYSFPTPTSTAAVGHSCCCLVVDSCLINSKFGWLDFLIRDAELTGQNSLAFFLLILDAELSGQIWVASFFIFLILVLTGQIWLASMK